MKKRFLATLMSIFLILNVSISVKADTLSDNKVKFNEISTKAKDLDSEIANLNSQISTLNHQISNNQSEINKVQSEIDKTNKQIDQINKDIKSNQELLSARLREIYKSGTGYSADLVKFILESDSLSDFYNRVTSSKKLVETDNAIIDKNKDLSNQLEESNKVVKEKKDGLETLHSNIQNNLTSVNSKQQQVVADKEALNNEMASLAAAIAENEQKLIQHSLDVINSSSPSRGDLDNSILTLSALQSQITTQSIRQTVASAIALGKDKLSKMPVPVAPAVTAAPTAPTAPAVTASLSSPPTDAKKTLNVELTAYSGDGTTKMGLKTVRDPNGISSVAVDPNVIPLGSKLYIPGYGYAIASDTGGVIQGNIIDLFMNTTEECLEFGRQQATITIVAYPGEW